MTLLELITLIKKQWYLVVILPIVFGLATGIFCWGFMTNDYTASVSLYILAKSDKTEPLSAAGTEFSTSQQVANDVAVLAVSNRVERETAEKLGLKDLEDYRIGVDSSTQNRVIELNVTGKRPELVAEVANTLAEVLAQTGVELMDLQAINIVDEALVPDEPSGPNRLLYTLVGVLVGVVVAIAILVLKDLLDTTVKSSEEVEELYGLPVLGNMPKVRQRR